MVDAHDNETYTAQDSRLIWIDCEMTGLDIFHDELVEISVVPTDFDLNVLDEGIDYVIKPSKAAVDQMNDFVRRMHTHSGLINEWEHGLDVSEAEAKVIEYVRRFTPKGVRPLLAGNSVGSDKKFLDRYMPGLMEHLHYRCHRREHHQGTFAPAGIRPYTTTSRPSTAATARSPTSSNRSTSCATTVTCCSCPHPVPTTRPRPMPPPHRGDEPAAHLRAERQSAGGVVPVGNR